MNNPPLGPSSPTFISLWKEISFTCHDKSQLFIYLSIHLSIYFRTMGWISYYGVRMNRSATTWLFCLPTTSRPWVVGSTIVLPLYPTKIWLGDSFVPLAAFKDDTLWPQVHNDSSNVMLHKLFLPLYFNSWMHTLTIGRKKPRAVPRLLSLSPFLLTHGSPLQPSTHKPIKVIIILTTNVMQSGVNLSPLVVPCSRILSGLGWGLLHTLWWVGSWLPSYLTNSFYGWVFH